MINSSVILCKRKHNSLFNLACSSFPILWKLLTLQVEYWVTSQCWLRILHFKTSAVTWPEKISLFGFVYVCLHYNYYCLKLLFSLQHIQLASTILFNILSICLAAYYIFFLPDYLNCVTKLSFCNFKSFAIVKMRS